MGVRPWHGRTDAAVGADDKTAGLEGFEIMPRWTATAEERFWAKVDKNGPIPEVRPDLGQCWLWIGRPIGAGYGGFLGRNGRTTYAHRFAYQLLIGSIPEQLEIDHLCRAQLCVNPSHMEPVTHLENVRRGRGAEEARKRQLAKGECPQGHPYDLVNTYFWRGFRSCRICNRAKRVRYENRKQIKVPA